MDRLREMAEEFHGEYDPYGIEPSIQEVSAQSYDGFIAHTNGGLRLLVPVSLDEYEVPSAVQEEVSGYREAAANDAAEEFMRERMPEQYEVWGDELEGASGWLVNYLYDAEREYDELNKLQPDMFGKRPPFWETELGALREEFYEFESEWLREGGTYFLDFTVLFYEADHPRNLTGVDEIYLFAGVNTDFEYGRERGHRTFWDSTVPVTDSTPELLAECMAEIAEDYSAEETA